MLSTRIRHRSTGAQPHFAIAHEALRPKPAGRRDRVGRRPGFTLIECVGVISLVGMLLSLSSVLLHRAFEVHRGALQSFRQLEQVNYWSERWRSDASQAVEANIDTDLSLTRDSGEIVRYSLQEQQLVRSVLREQRLLSQEMCTGWPVVQTTWQVDSSGQLPLLVGQLQFANTDPPRAPLEWVARLPNVGPTK